MKKTYLYYFLFLMLSPILVQSQVKSKLWYDGNSRVIFNRDALEGTLKDIDTVSTRSNGGGSTVLDLGFHFTPVDDIEIFSEIRLKNDFGGMWGNKSVVELRRLSAKGIINNKITFSIGDIYLKQTNFTLYNFQQDLSEYEPSVSKFYRDYVNYENYYQSNYRRLQGLQTNFSYSMYNFIEQIDVDAFSARVRGVEWLGEPELLMLGGSAILKLSNKINLGSHYVNTFEVLSSSNGTVAYYNPVLNTQISYSGLLNDNPYKMLLEGGFSKRGWDGDSLSPEINGNFIQASIHSKKIKSELDLSFRYVDSDFRSMGAQTRRIQYNSTNSTYPYYSNNYTQRKVSLLDIMSDPNVYNQNLSTSLMNYNPMYSSVSPYGDATPNRIGFTGKISNMNLTDFFIVNVQTQYFTEVIGQGTNQKRMLYKSALNSIFLLDKLLSTKKSLILEGSMNLETVNRGGEDFEKIDFNSVLFSGSISYELIKNFKLIAGTKVFYAEGNEFLADRDEFDQINDYSNHFYDTKETILIAGLQHHFTDDIYFTMQYNQFNILDKTNTDDKFSLGRLIFMFNMNL